MPWKRRTYSRPAVRHYRRRRAAKRIQRAYRKRRKVMTNRKLTRVVRGLQKASELKRTYIKANQVGFDNLGWFHLALDTIPLLTAPGVVPQIPAPYGRGEDTISCVLKNISIRCLVQARSSEAMPVNYAQVVLIRSSYRDPTTGSLTYPPLDDFYDVNAFTNVGGLAQFQLFSDPLSDLYSHTKILKKWNMTLSPPAQSFNITGITGTTATADEFPGGRQYPSEKLIRYNHNCRDAKLQFDGTSVVDTSPLNKRYYLLAITNAGVSGHQNLTISVCVKTSFKDD